MNHLFMALATGLYLGRLPRLREEAACVAALLAWLPLRGLPLGPYLILLLVLCILGFFAAGAAEKILDCADAPPIVIDEMVGMLTVLTMAPAHPLAWLLALVFFRLFDRIKPWPVGWIHRHIHGGAGIMGDDLAAGILAFFCTQLLWLPLGYLLT